MSENTGVVVDHAYYCATCTTFLGTEEKGFFNCEGHTTSKEAAK